MKRTSILVLVTLSIVAGLQIPGAAAQGKIPFIAAGDEGRIILRWTWPQGSLKAPQYKIHRRDLGSILWNPLTPHPITRIEDREEAKRLLGEDTYNKFEKMIYPEFPDPVKEPDEFREALKKSNELWSMTMFIADMDPVIAKVLGVIFVDKKVATGKFYEYQLTVVEGVEEKVVATTPAVREGRIPIPAPENVYGEAGDTRIFLRWEPTTRFSSYTVLRTEKEGGPYKKINDTPVVALKTVNEDGDATYPEWFFADQELENGKTYWYVIAGRDAFGRTGERSAAIELTPTDLTAPQPPQKLDTEVEDDRVTLTWERGREEDLAGYWVYRSSKYDGGFKRINDKLLSKRTERYVDKGLDLGKTYWYQVTAVDKEGNESGPGYVAPANVIDKIPPAVPAGLAGTADETGFSLTWEANTEEDLAGYRIYQATQKDADPYHQINYEPHKDAGFKMDKFEEAGGDAFYFKVTSIDIYGNESDPSRAIELMMPDVTPPGTPVFAKVEIEEGVVVLYWHPEKSEDLAGYNIFRMEQGQESAQEAMINTDLIPADKTSFKDKGPLSAGTRYVYTMEAVDTAENASIRSRPITAATFDRTPPDRPSKVGAEVVHSGEGILVTWEVPEGEELKGVILYRAKTEDGTFYPLTDFTKEASFLDEKVRDGRTYWYRLAAFDASNNRSEFSKVVSATFERKDKEGSPPP